MTSHGFASQSHQLNYEYSSVAHTHLLTRKNTNQPKGHYRINSVVCGIHTPVLFPRLLLPQDKEMHSAVRMSASTYPNFMLQCLA